MLSECLFRLPGKPLIFYIRRSIFGQGNYELSAIFQKFYISRYIWGTITPEEKDKLFQQIIANKTLTDKYISSSKGKLVIPNMKRPARTKGQRPKRAAPRTIPRFAK